MMRPNEFGELEEGLDEKSQELECPECGQELELGWVARPKRGMPLFKTIIFQGRHSLLPRWHKIHRCTGRD